MVNKMSLAMPLKVFTIILAVFNLVIGVVLSIQVYKGREALDDSFEAVNLSNTKGNGLMIINMFPLFLLTILCTLFAFLPYIAFPIINLVICVIGIILNIVAMFYALAVEYEDRKTLDDMKKGKPVDYQIYVLVGVVKHLEVYFDWLRSYASMCFFAIIILIVTIIIMGLALCRCCSRQQAGAEKVEDIEDQEETITFE